MSTAAAPPTRSSTDTTVAVRPARGRRHRVPLLRGISAGLTRLGLRARMTLAFAIGALALTALLSVTTLGFTRQVLLTQRENGALDFALRNAETVRNNLAQAEVLVSQLNTTYGSRPVIRVDDQWYAQNEVEFGKDDIPVALRREVEDDQPSRMRTTVDGTPVLLVGLPIPAEPDTNASYFEAISLEETADTLQVLSVILLVTSVGVTIVSAGAGYWASRRTLAPLSEVSQASQAIADGQLDTRLDPPADRDLARLVTRFNEMATALEQRIQRDARFASEVSHELRSPLMTLTASVAVLENSREELSPRAATALELLSTDVQRFSNLVEDLLEISRFDVGTARCELDDLDIIEFVRQVLRYRAEAHVSVDADPEADGLVVKADKRRLGRVLGNLLENADRYGGGATAVVVRCSDGVVLIAVEDEGPGVAPEERQVVFDRFSRGSAGGRRGDDTGMGLGLAIVAEDIHLHGGEVWVEDRPDGRPGARFVLTLPLDTGDRT